jgi:hypothetical protein
MQKCSLQYAMVAAVLLLHCDTTLAQIKTDSTISKGLIPAFAFQRSDMVLQRAAQQNLPFDRVGRKFAILGLESGIFEAWAYPLKLLRNFRLSFFLQNSTRPIEVTDVVRSIAVSPEATSISYVHQSFTVKATYVAALNEPGAMIFLDVSAVAPLKIVCSFIPVMQPMWPAGVGGQYAYWDNDQKAYIISETRKLNNGMVGSPAATGISYTPAHMLSDSPYEFPIEIGNPADVKGHLIPIYLAGGKGPRDSVAAVYKRLAANPEHYYRESVDHFRELERNTLQIHTPVREIDLAFKWAKVSYDNLFVDNPDLGSGLIAGLGMSGTSGRPGFGWFFGGDAFINSFSIDSYGGYAMVKDALKFTQKWQRNDGKMAHELTQAASYVDWFGNYPYGYIHGDTTPFYLAAMYDYFMMTGDAQFVRESWSSLRRAYEWCRSTDANGDGLMDNRKAGLGALEFGALTNIETDVYLAAVWVRAAEAMQFLARAAGDTKMATQAAADFSKGREAFRKQFWDEGSGIYTYAFNEKNELVKEITPWSSVGLTWGIGDSAHSLASLERLGTADMKTDWGIRTISQQSKYYDPLNYNYGTVWPFVTSWVATAMFKNHLVLQGYDLLLSSVNHTFDHQLGAVAEVFSGNSNIPLGEAVAHQGFSSAGVVLPLVRGLLGLEGNASEKSVSFAPHLPANWDSVTVSNYRIGAATFSFDYRRMNGRLVIRVQAKNATGYTVELSPALGPGTIIRSVQLDGTDQRWSAGDAPHISSPKIVSKVVKELSTWEIRFEPTVELLLPGIDTAPGDAARGIQIISIRRRGNRLEVRAQGLVSTKYILHVTHPEMIEQVEGAQLDGDRLAVTVPDGISGEYVPLRFIIMLK